MIPFPSVPVVTFERSVIDLRSLSVKTFPCPFTRSRLSRSAFAASATDCAISKVAGIKIDEVSKNNRFIVTAAPVLSLLFFIRVIAKSTAANKALNAQVLCT